MAKFNPVQQRIYDQIVRPAINDIAGMGIGVVVHSDHVTQTAVIQLTSEKHNADLRILPPAPMVHFGGVKQSVPLPGETVMVGFLSNSQNHPVILGRIDLEHGERTRPQKESYFRSGSNISDYYTMRQGGTW